MTRFAQQLLTITCSLAMALLSGCGSSVGSTSSDGRLRVVATTTIIGDVVRQIAGETIDLTILLPYDADPHSYEPTPQDTAKVAQADVVFVNGLGMEGFLDDLIANTGKNSAVYSLDEGIDAKHFAGSGEDHDEGGQPELSGDEHGDHESGDPHVWTDPVNVRRWADSIAATLSEHDPDHAALYLNAATEYKAQLDELDVWIGQEVATIPPERRLIVTDHQSFGYLADRYGLTQIAALIPGYSTASEPSARDLAALVKSIGEMGVPAIFVGKTMNPALAKRIAEDTGTRIVHVYTGSLGEPGGEAGTYLDYMRYNVRAITEALR